MKTWILPALTLRLILVPTLALVWVATAQTDTNRSQPSSSASAVTSPSTPQTDATKDSLPAGTIPQKEAKHFTTDSQLPPIGGVIGEAAPGGRPGDLHFSYWTTELMKLGRAGIDEQVLLSFIDTVGTFNLSATDIIELSDSGISSQVITAMIRHDFEVAAGLRVVTASASWPVAPPAFTSVNSTAAKSSTPSTAKAEAQPPPTPRPEPLPVNAPQNAARVAETTSPQIDYPNMIPPPPVPYIVARPLAEAASKKPRYAVREPYPEEVTPPIIMVRASGPSANVLLIEWSP